MNKPGNDAAKWQVAILHRTSRVVSSGLLIDAMLQEFVAITVELTACDACLIYLQIMRQRYRVARIANCRMTPRSARCV
jgi:hypothetical protein